MVYLTIFGYMNGNPYNAFRGVDDNGIVCGIGATYSFPYLYFTNPIEDITQRACVDACPSYTGTDLTTPNSYTTGTTLVYDIKYNSDGE